MIQIDEVHIEEVRGIRKLTLSLDRKTFAIQGPNGSGKSGVVDAIEFCLTGDMTRLSGHGTGALTVKAHGSHVDARDYPDKAFVRLKVYVPSLNKEATITRKVKDPRNATVEPEDADVAVALSEVAAHPELTLTRRQIAQFILAQATKRSKDIQALLRLEAIDEVRARLKTALNSTDRHLKDAESARAAAADALRRSLDLETLKVEELLVAVNKQRGLLGLDPVPELLARTSFTSGIAREDGSPKGPSKEAATRDLQALEDQINGGQDAIAQVLAAIASLESRPGLHSALRQRSLVEAGLAITDGDACPLCDTPWELDALVAHLQKKLETSKEAEALERQLMTAAQQLRENAATLHSHIDTAATLARSLALHDVEACLVQWRDDVGALRARLESAEGVMESGALLRDGWHGAAPDVTTYMGVLKRRVQGLPESSDRERATRLLIVAEERMVTLRQRKRDVEHKRLVSELARDTYNAYCEAANEVLQTLYETVENEFATCYRAINRDDESRFSAKLEPSAGKLDLSVDFYERGLFPPGAYHSEGHQDGMGLCLYLALMEQLLGSDFTIAILDDVVMSVDKQHRRELCRLLKERFPNTQFVITTHDEAWLRQMQASKLVTRKTAVMFRGWTVEDGPRVNNATDAWEKIERYLQDERVPDAATTLRRHLEFVFGEIAESVGAATLHKPDGNHDLGDLLPSSVSRMKEHLKAGVKAAKAWKNDDAQRSVEAMQRRFAECQARQGDEQWVVNKAVHFNEWADFAPEEFRPVVEACRDLVECFRCEQCGSWLTATPRTSARMLKCDCSAMAVNLELPR
ncbi:MAG: AAA family ATPase [Phycisphaerales bacterium JB038]